MSAGELVTTVDRPAGQVGIEELILRGIENNVAVESLERLLAMRNTLKAEAAREAFIDAMAAFQAECPVIAKSTAADRYKYAKLEDIVEQTSALRAKHGFSYKFNTRQETTPPQEIVECVVSHRAGHAESAEFRMIIGNIPGLTAMQQSGAAHSYAKRYAYCDAFGIVTGDDDTDGGPKAQAAARTGSAPPATPPASPAPAAPTRTVQTSEGGSLGPLPTCPHCGASRPIHQKQAGGWYCKKAEGGCGKDFDHPELQLAVV